MKQLQVSSSRARANSSSCKEFGPFVFDSYEVFLSFSLPPSSPPASSPQHSAVKILEEKRREEKEQNSKLYSQTKKSQMAPNIYTNEPEDSYKVWEFKELVRQKNSNEARAILERVTKQVQPLMKRRQWRVKLVREVSRSFI